MNIANINRVIKKLESVSDAEFNIAHLYSDRQGWDIRRYVCGSAACIAGYVNILQEGNEKWVSPHVFLGLDYDMAWKELFTPPGHIETPRKFTRLRAIATLKHLRDTGEVEWDRFTTSGRVRRSRPALLAIL